jgi:hypothetical protein
LIQGHRGPGVGLRSTCAWSDLAATACSALAGLTLRG